MEVKRRSDNKLPGYGRARDEKMRREPMRFPNGMKCNAGRCPGLMFLTEIYNQMYYRCNREGCIFNDEPVLAIERAYWTERRV